MSARLTIGLVTANIHLGVGATFWSGVLDAAQRNDVNVICFPGGEVHATDRPPNSVYDLVAPDLLDGLICWASTLGLPVAHARATRLARRFGRLPMVSVNGAIGEDSPLTLDSYRGMSTAISHLVEVHKRHKLAFIRGPLTNPVTVERYRAYTDTLARHRIPLDRSLVSAPMDFRREAGADAMRVLLDARALRPGRDFDAVVACSDFLAADALRVLSERGIRVPNDVAVVGVNDSPEARLADPPLTSVSMPFAELGELAVETLLCRLGTATARDRPAPVSTLVIRRSCGCLGPLTVLTDDEPIELGVDQLPELPREQLRTALLEALDDEAGLESERDSGFLRAVDRLVGTQMLRGNETDSWDAALVAVRWRVLSDVTGSSRVHAERLLAQARLIVGAAGRRLLEYERWDAEQTSRRLRELGNALSSVVDVPALTDVLNQQLPALGIPRWHLSLEASAALAPDGVLPRDRRYSMVAEPLYVRDELLGFGLFEVGPRDGAVYRALGDQIGATLKEMKLFHDVLDARDAAEQANRVKTTLLSSVSDELRTPVEGIRRHVARALESVEALAAAPPGLVESLKEINVSAEHQLGVISDLLDLTRAEIDTLDLSAELVDPRALLEDVFRTRLPGRLPLIQADRRRLRQALVTLRGAADRLGRGAGQVVVEADVLAPCLRIRVGCVGGRPSEQPADADAVGTALGLPLTRRLVTLHNGSLRFETGPDGGTFHVTLPLPCPHGQPDADRSTGCVLVVGARSPEATEAARRLRLPVRRLQAGEAIEAILEDTPPAAVAWDLTETQAEDWSVVRHLHDHPLLRATPFLLYDQPHRASRSRDLAEAIASMRPAGSAGPILIADAAPQARTLYQRLVGQLRPGHQVLVAPDGTTALALLALLGQEVPSLLILSNPLADMDAFDVLDRLHGDALTDVPALVLGNATVTTEDVRRAEPHPRSVLLGKGVLAEAETVELLARLLTPGGPPSHRSSLLVKHALAYLHRHYHHQITRRQVAKAVGMSEDYLSRLFNRELGLSPWDYLNRLRIQHAKERLRESDDSIQVVARRVGFHDRAYFSRTFRKLTGLSPQAFRESPRSLSD